MADYLTPDTTLALLKAAQNDAAASSDKLKNQKQLAEISAAAEEFEAVFVAEMMKPMFEGISTEAPFGGGKAEEIFRGMMLNEYGKLLAQSGNIGIADQVKAEMIRMQETASGSSLTDLETSPNQRDLDDVIAEITKDNNEGA